MPTWLWIILVNGLILGLIGYIWRGLEGRVRTLEEDKKEGDKERIKDPFLTVKTHDEMCVMERKELHDAIQVQTNTYCAKIAETEERMGLKLTNEILSLKIALQTSQRTVNRANRKRSK